MTANGVATKPGGVKMHIHGCSYRNAVCVAVLVWAGAFGAFADSGDLSVSDVLSAAKRNLPPESDVYLGVSRDSTSTTNFAPGSEWASVASYRTPQGVSPYNYHELQRLKGAVASDGRYDFRTLVYSGTPDTPSDKLGLLTGERRTVWDGATYWSGVLPIDGSPTDMYSWMNTSRRVEDAKRFQPDAFAGRELFGVLPGDRVSVIDILKMPEMNAKVGSRKSIGDAQCVSIVASGPNGDYEVWFDLDHNYAIRKASIVKDASDIAYGDKTVSEVYTLMDLLPHNGRDPGSRKTPLTCTKFESTFDSSSPALVDGHFVLKSAAITVKKELADGSTTGYVESLTIDEFNPSPDWDQLHVFDMSDVPSGTVIRKLDDPAPRPGTRPRVGENKTDAPKK